MTNSERKIRIQKMMESGNFPHALLFSGPKHTGKFAFVKSLIPLLLPENFRLPPDLVLVDKLWQADVLTDMEEIAKFSTFDQSHRKKDNKKTDTIGIDDIKECTHQIFETTNAPYKLVLVRDIERMNEESSNNFLKILEEPPAKTLFLMTSSAPSQILPTILSRVQHEEFSLSTNAEMDAFLDAENVLIASVREEKKMMAAGRMEILEKLLQDGKFFATQKEMWNEIRKIMILSPTQKLAKAEEIAEKNTEDLMEFFFVFENFLHSHLHTQLLSGMPKKNWIENQHAFAETKKGMVQNGNRKLLLEAFFLGLHAE